MMSEQSQPETQNQLTLFVEDSPARMSQLPENGRDLLASGLDYGASLHELLRNLSRDGSWLKMSPVFYPRIKGETLKPSSVKWSKAGMAFAGGYLTLNISELPRDAGVCSLSEVLETDAPQKYYLSAKACAGILCRAEKRGKELPETLKYALMKQVKDSGQRDCRD